MFSTFKKAALLAAIALPFSTMAAPTVTFQGEVTNQTCSRKYQRSNQFSSIDAPRP